MNDFESSVVVKWMISIESSVVVKWMKFDIYYIVKLLYYQQQQFATTITVNSPDRACELYTILSWYFTLADIHFCQ